jgi:hypothetical protein
MARLNEETWQGKDVFSIRGKNENDVIKLGDLFRSVNKITTYDPIRKLFSTGEYCIFFRVDGLIQLPYPDCKLCLEPMLNCICKEPKEITTIDFQNPLGSLIKIFELS